MSGTLTRGGTIFDDRDSASRQTGLPYDRGENRFSHHRTQTYSYHARLTFSTDVFADTVFQSDVRIAEDFDFIGPNGVEGAFCFAWCLLPSS